MKIPLSSPPASCFPAPRPLLVRTARTLPTLSISSRLAVRQTRATALLVAVNYAMTVYVDLEPFAERTQLT